MGTIIPHFHYIITLIFALDITLLIFSKRDIHTERVHSAYSAILIAIGFLGIIPVCYLTDKNLRLCFEDDKYFYDMWQPMQTTFNQYLVISIIIVTLFIIYSIVRMKRNKKYLVIDSGYSLGLFIVLFVVFIFIYSINTINKIFDISAYIGMLGICEIFILHIPILVRRKLIGKT